MAKCGCSRECNCQISTGQCLTISGDGNADTPYVIEVEPDNDTIFCQGGVLVAVLNTLDSNTVDLTGDGTAANPLMADVILTPDANVPDPDGIGTGNLIKIGPTGIYVSCEDVQDCVGAAISQINVADCLFYDDPTNTIRISICAAPNGVQCRPAGDPDCPAGGLLVTPSTDANNSLVFGTDLRLFAPATAVAPGDCMTMTGTGVPGDPFVFSPQIAPELNGVECSPTGLLVFPSSDANNGLIFGSDNRLWIDRCPFLIDPAQVLAPSPGNGPCFDVIGDGCATPLTARIRISPAPCQGLECRADGLFVEMDPTPLPDVVSNTRNTPGFPGLGPFNGTGNQVVDGPNCIVINNPSPCRNMITTGTIGGFTDVGRQNGEMGAFFEVSDNPGGPFITVHRNVQAEPSPPSRATLNAAWRGSEVVIPPGGNRQICTRTTVNFVGVQTGRLFFSEKTLSLIGRWAS